MRSSSRSSDAPPPKVSSTSGTPKTLEWTPTAALSSSASSESLELSTPTTAQEEGRILGTDDDTKRGCFGSRRLSFLTRKKKWSLLLCTAAVVVVVVTTSLAVGIPRRKSVRSGKNSLSNNSYDDQQQQEEESTSTTTPQPSSPVTMTPTVSPTVVKVKPPPFFQADPNPMDEEEQSSSNSTNTTIMSPATTSSIPLASPTPAPTPAFNGDAIDGSHPPTYVPGNLTTYMNGLLLSEGLSAKIIAHSGEKVELHNGGGGGTSSTNVIFDDKGNDKNNNFQFSKDKFHGMPDAGATFPIDDGGDDTSDDGGWIYVSNSELENQKGGVGAMTFDKDGNVVKYQVILQETTMNCGGGRTPWNTWISCEEVEFDGVIYQVDPTGRRESEIITLGSDGGRWESFAYDIRNKDNPRFFVTEDHNKGTVRRFTPQYPYEHYSDDLWNMLHGNGTTDYLMIVPDELNDGTGTFVWTDDILAAKDNARMYYPQTEGIDVYQNELFFVCKRIKQLFVLNLDDGTYYNTTTVSGLFNGKPDQISRLVVNNNEDDGDGSGRMSSSLSNSLLYFTEEGGLNSGVHARDSVGRFYTIFESPDYNDETTGLAFSPNGKYMYVSYQVTGILYTIWRNDGLPFQQTHLDLKYHSTSSSSLET